MEIGGYALGQRLDSRRMPELSDAEYALLPRQFDGERIFHAGSAEFRARACDVVLGVIHDRIYKIAVQFLYESSDAASGALSDLARECAQEFGKAASSVGDTARWDTGFGNVVLDVRSGAGQHAVNLFLTSGELIQAARAATGMKRSGLRGISWEPAQHTDQENVQWAWLRAVEWSHWPLFVTLPIVPVMLLIYPLWLIVVVLLACELVWSQVRYRVVSSRWATAAALGATARWITGPVSAVVLATHGRWVVAVVALFWPGIAPLVGVITRPQIGRIQEEFLQTLGYADTSINPRGA